MGRFSKKEGSFYGLFLHPVSGKKPEKQGFRKRPLVPEKLCGRLLSECTGKPVPRVQIPLSPPNQKVTAGKVAHPGRSVSEKVVFRVVFSFLSHVFTSFGAAPHRSCDAIQWPAPASSGRQGKDWP